MVNIGRTRNYIIQEATEDYLDTLNPDNPPSPKEIEQELMGIVEDDMLLENEMRAKGHGHRLPNSLCAMQIAMILLKLYPIVCIKGAGSVTNSEYDLLTIYESEGENQGIYVSDLNRIKHLASQYNFSGNSSLMSDVITQLRLLAPHVDRTIDKDLIPVNNGVFNYDTKELMPFSPEYVFLAKSKVNYNPDATNIVIHNDDDGTDWDVESWMDELSDDPEIVDLLWQILSAIIRPFVRWNKSAWFYSETGNNGKGTLCELMRALCGENSYASIPLSDFSKDFALEPLLRTMAIITDENDVGGFIDKVANLKAIVTNDVVSINRKHKMPVSYQFFGFMVQCLNEFPRIKDKSDSFYRRQLFIPFDKCFTNVERKYIKEDYLHRQEVLEYVLYRVLNMNFYTLSEPARCRDELDKFKDFNDPVRQFWAEMEERYTWDLLPFTFLYDHYKSWFRKNNPSGFLQGKGNFIKEILNVIKESSIWVYTDRSVRSKNRMDRPEPLIVEYDLIDWKNDKYVGSDPDRISMPKLNENYKGLERR